MDNDELKRAGEVMIAAAGGKLIECKMKKEQNWYDLGNPNRGQWDFSLFDYRVKPQKKLRPWTPDEVPVGSQVKMTDWHTVNRVQIIAVGSDGVAIPYANGSYRHVDFSTLKDTGTYSTDGGKTWRPCGVEVEE